MYIDYGLKGDKHQIYLERYGKGGLLDTVTVHGNSNCFKDVLDVLFFMIYLKKHHQI